MKPSLKGFVPLGPGNSAEAQSCHIKLGSWVHDARHINLTAFAGTDQLTMEDMSRNSPWVLESQEQGAIKFTSYDCCPEPYMVAHYRSAQQSVQHKTLKCYAGSRSRELSASITAKRSLMSSLKILTKMRRLTASNTE